ncbi:16S rRNA (cytosine(1402)-N(4))-methyltransferase RsmH [Polynucleobacter kasalickyi]|uniref:Ribosomal RNA small subunit methyltransferase H n=1 Tax=Polynucleobacter kasalickyi TaxID=1938817 RepID=A0A1W2AF31_9BURK|nr:16S rRNA (cytosine(1402)-N(4))-methyltransferase RsmH [Polynucleobacter kasalickyi]SMC59061.1 16S rRNA (cytosine1402-N4)-methyltransferase [Polynucleobacter kasalickyi]
MHISHRPVLLDEAVTALLADQPHVSPTYLDGTFGRGGHSRKILANLPQGGRLIAMDKDPQAIQEASSIEDGRFRIVHDSFANMGEYLEPNSLDGILLDLGISSPQIDQAERGFSFRMDGPLDMRMNNKEGQSAQEWLAVASEKELHKVIKEYGEERFALSIAKAIVASREQGNIIGTTRQLASLVASVVRSRDSEQDPATRTFQAIRIHINQELHDLEKGLDVAMKLLKIGGRLVVISFHSLEDRIVKQFMQRHSKVEIPRGLPLRESQIPKSPLRLIERTKPTSAEISSNPRSRSAVMRVAQKIGEVR